MLRFTATNAIISRGFDNGKLNEAIGLGHMEYRITPDALPQPESWDAIQKELQRNGLKDIAADPDGIVIKLRQ